MRDEILAETEALQVRAKAAEMQRAKRGDAGVKQLEILLVRICENFRRERRRVERGERAE
jgi:hypothetical protein